MGGRGEDIAAGVADALASRMSPTDDLIAALDAPLGWPSALGAALANHAAGDALPADSNTLFRRRTDNAIHGSLGLRPLEIGADRIARAAVTALRVLARLRLLVSRVIPVAVSGWGDSRVRGPVGDGLSVAIEVYPAAYLTVHGPVARKYKDRDALPLRESILDSLARRIAIPNDARVHALADADVLDALVCIASSVDYLNGAVLMPPAGEDLTVEGWAWVPLKQ